jgi:xylulokinase
MSFTHGVGIGANGSRGVMVDPGGEVIAQAERPHKMPMRRPGWAEHRTGGDWWRGFSAIAQGIISVHYADPER